MSLLVRILTSIILMNLKYPCLWVFKDPSIDFKICHGYLCKYLWQIYRLESIVVTCQDLKMNINDFSYLRYSKIVILIDNCMISISSLLNTCEYLLITHEYMILMRIWVALKNVKYLWVQIPVTHKCT